MMASYLIKYFLQIGCYGYLIFLSIPLFASGAGSLGRQIALGKGNCVACHQLNEVALSGDVGPSLRNLKQRYLDKQSLRRQIWDPQTLNPRTVMPPYGRHQILTEQEIDALVDYLYH